jgi:hypothetical protein
LYVFYLETNGLDGNVDLLDLPAQGMKLKNSASDFGISQTLYAKLIRPNTQPALDSSVEFQYTLGDTVI